MGPAQEDPVPGVSFRVLVDEPLVAAVAPDHPLAGGTGAAAAGAGTGAASGVGGLPLEALRGLPLISLPRGTGTRGVLERACARAGFRPRVVFEAADPRFLAQLAGRGLGVAVVPRPAESVTAGSGLLVLPFAAPVPRARIVPAWRTAGPTGPAAAALLARLRTGLATAPA
ncbi:LysR family transcriptional regulator substrate-binding protein [Streptomyces manipurensis]|uniref:LysR family transcriptional regulator substrate-binding protein n=1 Tax=Streptomyces manipurensis TaxID=1077945 RepID=UPI003C6F8890